MPLSYQTNNSGDPISSPSCLVPHTAHSSQSSMQPQKHPTLLKTQTSQTRSLRAPHPPPPSIPSIKIQIQSRIPPHHPTAISPHLILHLIPSHLTFQLRHRAISRLQLPGAAPSYSQSCYKAWESQSPSRSRNVSSARPSAPALAFLCRESGAGRDV